MQHVHTDHNAIKVHIKVCYIWGEGMKISYSPFTSHCTQSFSLSLSSHHIPAFSISDSRLQLLLLLIIQTKLHKYKNTLSHVLNSHI